MTPREIREWRTTRGLSQAEMAAWLSADAPPVDHKTVWRWEAGTRKPPPFLRLALRWLDRFGPDS